MTHAATVATIRATLVEVFGQLDAWFDSPPQLRAFRPASGGWSIDLILEHLGLANHFLMLTLGRAVERTVARAADAAAMPVGESDLERLRAVGEHGAFPWTHPPHMEPTGARPASEVRAELREQAAQCHALLDRLGDGGGARGHLHMSVDKLGRIDLYQWMYFLVQHARRHLQQMRAIEREFAAQVR